MATPQSWTRKIMVHQWNDRSVTVSNRIKLIFRSFEISVYIHQETPAAPARPLQIALPSFKGHSAQIRWKHGARQPEAGHVAGPPGRFRGKNILNRIQLEVGKHPDISRNRPLIDGMSKTNNSIEAYFSQRNTGWWFEPLWKILVNWDDSFNIWKNKTCCKPPNRYMFSTLSKAFYCPSWDPKWLCYFLERRLRRCLSGLPPEMWRDSWLKTADCETDFGPRPRL